MHYNVAKGKTRRNEKALFVVWLTLLTLFYLGLAKLIGLLENKIDRFEKELMRLKEERC